MGLALILACLWAVVANLAAMLPSRRNHWPAAFVLIATGVPILGYVTYQNGPWIGLIVLAVGASMLRWPILRAGRWLGSRLRRRPVEEAADAAE